MLGLGGVPISNVVRSSNKLHPKPLMDEQVSAYKTYDEEMIKRSLISVAGNTQGTEEDGPFNEFFIADRSKVWNLISPLIIKTEAWPHIKNARTSRDGIKAMLTFHHHFMGPNNVDYIQKQAEQKLLSLSYQVERNNCTFKRFVTAHKGHCTIIEGLTDHR